MRTQRVDPNRNAIIYPDVGPTVGSGIVSRVCKLPQRFDHNGNLPLGFRLLRLRFPALFRTSSKSLITTVYDCLHSICPEEYMERRLRRANRAIRKAMIALKSSPYLIVGLAITTLLILLSLRNYEAADSTPFRWSFSNQPSPSLPIPANGNYNSASSKRKKIDTTSEIGRASNATLGVRSFYFLPMFIVQCRLIPCRTVPEDTCARIARALR